MIRAFLLFVTHNFSACLYLILFTILLIFPSFVYFHYLKLEFAGIFNSPVDNRLLFPKSQYEFLEILPWLIVAATAILVMAGNAFIYFLTFENEKLMDGGQSAGALYKLILFFFIIWSIYFFLYSIFTTIDLYNFKSSIVEFTNQTISNQTSEARDLKLKGVLVQFLNNIIRNLETYISITISLFIIIHVFSLRIKKLQFYAIKDKREEIAQDYNFIALQLLCIDFPVLIGILLIHHFTSILSEIDVSADTKSVFIVGGIAMHIILSQIVFVMLAFRNSYMKTRYIYR